MYNSKSFTNLDWSGRLFTESNHGSKLKSLSCFKNWIHFIIWRPITSPKSTYFASLLILFSWDSWYHQRAFWDMWILKEIILDLKSLCKNASKQDCQHYDISKLSPFLKEIWLWHSIHVGDALPFKQVHLEVITDTFNSFRWKMKICVHIVYLKLPETNLSTLTWIFICSFFKKNIRISYMNRYLRKLYGYMYLHFYKISL